MIELTIKHTPQIAGNSDATVPTIDVALVPPDSTPEVIFVGQEAWQRSRPRTLVVACSDGRLQKSIDEFLERRLGVVDYDRLYAPGGPGVLASGSADVKTDQFRRELRFLVQAHSIEEIVLLFHGAHSSGPHDAICAHYKRLLPAASRQEILRQQFRDAGEALRLIAEIAPTVQVHLFRAEVWGDGTIHFVDLRR